LGFVISCSAIDLFFGLVIYLYTIKRLKNNTIYYCIEMSSKFKGTKRTLNLQWKRSKVVEMSYKGKFTRTEIRDRLFGESIATTTF